jgi:5-methyltetrahydrofolate--homocysteine methyltransferase
MNSPITTTLSSKTRTVTITRGTPTVIIGERINPTGRKQVLAALQSGDFETVRRDALAQVQAGAQILDVNAGVPGMDEIHLLPRVIKEVMSVTDVPLCIDTANPAALAAALQVYQGKALINSVNGEQSSLSSVLPLAKQHSAAVIALCMDNNGIPATAEQRLAVAAKIIDRALQVGIPLEDVIIDPLVMAVSADGQAGAVTLAAITHVVGKWGLNVAIGASNVSFGLPNRAALNAAFLAIAIHAGATCPITNPLEPALRSAVLAADLTLGRDDYATRWIRDFRARKK